MNFFLINTLLKSPPHGWEQIREKNLGVRECYGKYVIPLALITPVATFFGTTVVGWQVGARDSVRLTMESAIQISLGTFVAMLLVVYVIARTIFWMARTYDSHTTLARCFSLAAFSATPLFLVGSAMIYPRPWFIYLLGLPMLAYSIALLYSGVPIMMEVNKERGFLFANAIMAFGLVALVGLIAVTVSFWGVGLGPSFVTH